MAYLPVVSLTLLGVITFLAKIEVNGEKFSSDEFLRIQPRIIGGAELQNRCRSPYNSIVALQFESVEGPTTFCSSVMLTSSILVTSAFCASQIDPTSDLTINAVVGERDMSMQDADEQRIPIESRKLHPGYNSTTYDNNIALLRLARPAKFSSCVKPAFKMENDPAVCTDIDKSCLIVGWGLYVENSKPTNSRLARYASVTVFGSVISSLLSRFERGVDPPVGSIFAEAINPNIKACFFDWGGIVTCQRNGNYVLRGIIGEHNCITDPTPPILVTDVPFYQTWLDRCTGNWDLC